MCQDNKTHIKIQAMLIYEEENEAKENERFDRFR